MDFYSHHSIHIKQEVEVKDEIDTEAPIKIECSDSQSQNESVLAVDCDRIKSEEVKLEKFEIIYLTDDSVSYIKADELNIEKSEPKIETMQDNKNYNSDATTDSDVVLERMMSEYVKMENQGATMEINEAVKIEDDDQDVNVKMETGDTDMDMVSCEFEDSGIQQLTEEFKVKEEDDILTAEVPESASKKNAQEERRSSSKFGSYPVSEELNRHVVANNKVAEKSPNGLNLKGGAYSTSHYETLFECNSNICMYCNTKFKNKSTLDDHIIMKHPDFISSSKILECAICSYKTIFKSTLIRHIRRHPESVRHKSITCIHCNGTFQTKAGLDDHILREHPNFVSSVSRKIYECTKCICTTTTKRSLDKHMRLKHTKTSSSHSVTAEDMNVVRGNSESPNLHVCTQCDVIYKSRKTLNEHIIKNHPDLVASNTDKIYECPNCAYKTVFSTRLTTHLLTNCKIGSRYKLSKQIERLRICLYCNATYTMKLQLNDHIVKKHPKFMTTVSSKIYSCENCTYKTTIRRYLDQHIMQHPEAAADWKYKSCKHCSATFRNDRGLGDHILKRHPDFALSVPNKVHKCRDCAYKTTHKSNLDSHRLMIHAETTSSRKLSACTQCNATFTRNQTRDEHMLRRHPDFITEISSKIHECSKCMYKTTNRRLFSDHISRNHPDSLANVSTKIHVCGSCTYKTTIKSRFQKHLKKHPV